MLLIHLNGWLAQAVKLPYDYYIFYCHRTDIKVHLYKTYLNETWQDVSQVIESVCFKVGSCF